MARKLQAEGETVSTLALIDAYPYRPPRKRRTVEVGRAQYQAFKSPGLGGRREWARKRVHGIAARGHRALYLRIGPRVYERLAAIRMQRIVPARPWNLVLIASNLARRRYVPTPLDVRIDFFRAQRSSDAGATPWENLATQGVELRQIVAPDITHASMMHEPHVQMLADQLMQALDHERREERAA